MADGKSFDYCDSDEEVFIGKITDKEMLKAALFGQNYYSPDVKTSTPRSKVVNKNTKLPDVLYNSACTASPTGPEEVSPTNTKAVVDEHSPSLNATFSENNSIEIVDLESINNSVQIISDDESFLLNEKAVQGNDSVLDKEKICLEKGLQNLSLSSINKNFGFSKPDYTLSSDNNKCESNLSRYPIEGTYQNQVGTLILKDTNKTDSMISNQNVEAFENPNKTAPITSNRDIEALEYANKSASMISNKDVEPLEDANKTASMISYQDVEPLEDNNKTASMISYQDVEALEDANKIASMILNQDEHVNKTASMVLNQDIEPLEDTNKTASMISNQDVVALEYANKTASTVSNQDIETLEYARKTASTVSNQGVEALEYASKTTSMISSQNTDDVDETYKTASILSDQDATALEDTNKRAFLLSDHQAMGTIEDVYKSATDIFQHTFEPVPQELIEYKDSTNNFEHSSLLDKPVNEDSVNSVKENVVGRLYEPFKNSEINSSVLQDSQMDSSVQLDLKSSPISEEKYFNKKSSLTKNSLSNSEYVSINCISDSVLDISRGSSLSVSSDPITDSASKCWLAHVVHENISCDEQPQMDSTNRSDNALSQSFMQNGDLHMSVDEHDYHESLQTVNCPVSANTFQPLWYNPDFEKSSTSSYYTALNTHSENPSLKPSVDSLNSYREPLNETRDLEDIDMATSLDIESATKNETSFEMIVQNRQNSFTAPSPPSVQIANNTEEVKSKVVSKLPVYNYGCKSFIKPPKLNIKSESLKSKNYKWAMNLHKSETDRIYSSKDKTGAAKKDVKSKIASPFPKSNALPKSQQKIDKIANQMICTNTSNGLKSQLLYKTPAKNTAVQAGKSVNSESKPASLISSNIKYTMSSGKKIKSKTQLTCPQDKGRFKNIISPIRLYISGSPSVLQEKAVAFEETKLVVGSGNKNINSHLPIRVANPQTASKVAQKLDYNKTSQQENVDPNYSRDTLPPRALQSSAAVFMKEPEPPKTYMPKIGANLQKLLDTPRPKVVLHHGRVKNSPNTKGILVPSFDAKSSECDEDISAARVSVRLVKTAESTHVLK